MGKERAAEETGRLLKVSEGKLMGRIELGCRTHVEFSFIELAQKISGVLLKPVGDTELEDYRTKIS